MSLLITDPMEIDSILNSGSYTEFTRLIPTLQEGMHRLWSRWEGSEKEVTPYGVWLTGEVGLTHDMKTTSNIRIYTEKTVMVGQEEYTVIASHCYDEYDDRNNYREEGDMHVVLLAQHEDMVYLLSGSYHYLYKGSDWEDNYSIAGYPEGGSLFEEGEQSPGLVAKSAVSLADFIPQLAHTHSGYGNVADTPEVFSIRHFKSDLAFIAMLVTCSD